MILKKINKEKGSGVPNKEKIGKLSRRDLEEIAQKKLEDLNTADISQAVKIVAGTARNMGVEVTT